MTTRWTLEDPAAVETWVMPINPDSASGFGNARSLTFAGGYRRDQRTRTFQGAPPELTLEWAGVIRTQAHYDELLRWSRKSGATIVTDHLGRQRRVFITEFQPTDRKPIPRAPLRWRYVMKATLLAVL